MCTLEGLLEKKLEQIDQYQNLEKQLEKHLSANLAEFCSLGAKRAIVQVEKQKLREEIKLLDEGKEMEDLTSEKRNLEIQFEDELAEIAEEEKEMEEKRQEMEEFRSKFKLLQPHSKKVEEFNQIQAKIQEKGQLAKWMAENKEEASTVVSGRKLNEVRDKYSNLATRRAFLQKEIQEVDEKTNAVRQAKTDVEQQTDVYKKRNVAQFTHLQKQVEKAKRKNEVSQKKAFELEQEIFELKRSFTS